ncbi:hypothetical protein PV16_00590 [Salmonella enterica subsp. enterica serovar Typhimurium]|nr:hypothetical protein [Salmonella enterica subsp. enterica serovar Typhimurium]
MKGKYKAALALLLLLILIPLTLLMTLGLWVPTLAGIWLPVGTRIALEQSPRLTRHGLVIPDLRYLVNDCSLAHITQAELTHPSRWLLNIKSLKLDAACLAKLPATEASPAAPRTLAQWQSMLPNTWINIDNVILAPWPEWQGKLAISMTPVIQQIRYQGEKVKFQGQLRGQALTVSQLEIAALANQPPVSLAGEFVLPLVPDGLPVSGHAAATLRLPQEPSLVDAELEWRDNAGQLIVMARGNPDPILDLPWAVTRQRLTISDGRWNWPYQGFPLSGRLAFNIDNWQAGPDNAQVSGRLNILTQGDAGKANAVLTIGPGKLSMDSSEMPLQLTGEAKQKDLIFYAVLPAMFRGSLADPQLTFAPGALLRSRGRVIDALDIDEIRWPLAGVKVTPRGVDGRLQAILRAHENEMGDFVLHLDGLANDFHTWTKHALLNAIAQPEQFVEISETLAAAKGIANGDYVKVSSKRGFIRAVAVVTRRLRTLHVNGQQVETVGIPIHWGFEGVARKGYIANTLTPNVGDANSQTPEYKAFLVNIEKA